MTDATSLKPDLRQTGTCGRALGLARPGHRHPEVVSGRHVVSLGVVVTSRGSDEILARAAIFQGVEPSAVSALTKQLHPADFPRGHVVFAHGERGDLLGSGADAVV
jgi:hypothetical protein